MELVAIVAIDDSIFRRLVGRTLDNALNFELPQTIEYRGVEVENETIARKIGAWAIWHYHHRGCSAFGQKGW